MSGTLTEDKLVWIERIAFDTSVHSTAVRVAAVIAMYGKGCFSDFGPSISTIASAASVSDRTVGRAISALCRAGYLDKCRAGFALPNAYCLSFPKERLNG